MVVAGTGAQIMTPDTVKPADCILVPGSGLLADGTPGETLRRRLDMAIGLYHRGLAPMMVMSGDHRSDAYDEVNAMRIYAEAHGVPADCILLDHAGYSTFETMCNTARMPGIRRAIVVTQEYHLYRALWSGNMQGLQMQGVACERYHYSDRFTLWLDIREVLARCKDIVYNLLPIPTP